MLATEHGTVKGPNPSRRPLPATGRRCAPTSPLSPTGEEGRVRGATSATLRAPRYTRPAMRIATITPLLVDVPLRSAVHGVHGTTAVQRSVLVRVTTDEGVEGWGNVDPTPGYSLVSAVNIHDAVARLAPVLVGVDAFNLNST